VRKPQKRKPAKTPKGKKAEKEDQKEGCKPKAPVKAGRG
jgi:hypothetical protein